MKQHPLINQTLLQLEKILIIINAKHIMINLEQFKIY